MAIDVLCPGCSTKLTLDEKSAGESFDCPHCDTTFALPPSVGKESVREDVPPPPTKFCTECGKSIRKRAEICPECGVRQPMPRSKRSGDSSDLELDGVSGKKLAAGLCGIFVGGFGVHKFILGYNRAGLIMLLSTLFTCGIGYAIIHVIGIVEGIIYLTKTDEAFNRIYLVRKKEWF